jgi:hypothetical protein
MGSEPFSPDRTFPDAVEVMQAGLSQIADSAESLFTATSENEELDDLVD